MSVLALLVFECVAFALLMWRVRMCHVGSCARVCACFVFVLLLLNCLLQYCVIACGVCSCCACEIVVVAILQM